MGINAIYPGILVIIYFHWKFIAVFGVTFCPKDSRLMAEYPVNEGVYTETPPSRHKLALGQSIGYNFGISVIRRGSYKSSVSKERGVGG